MRSGSLDCRRGTWPPARFSSRKRADSSATCAASPASSNRAKSPAPRRKSFRRCSRRFARKALVLRLAAALCRFAAAVRLLALSRAARASRAAGRGAGMLRRGGMLLPRKLAVVILVELAEVLVVRRAFDFLFRHEAVVVLVERLEHRFGAAVGLGRAAGGGFVAARGGLVGLVACCRRRERQGESRGNRCCN